MRPGPPYAIRSGYLIQRRVSLLTNFLNGDIFKIGVFIEILFLQLRMTGNEQLALFCHGYGACCNDLFSHALNDLCIFAGNQSGKIVQLPQVE